jgi:hypothetical protein
LQGNFWLSAYTDAPKRTTKTRQPHPGLEGRWSGTAEYWELLLGNNDVAYAANYNDCLTAEARVCGEAALSISVLGASRKLGSPAAWDSRLVVRPAGRTYLEVEVLCGPGKGNR